MTFTSIPFWNPNLSKSDGGCMREIGSEFWTRRVPAQMDTADNIAYLLSGRTALKFIIDDICERRSLQRVLLPSYCCESMIKPFMSAGVDVRFYPVHENHLEYPYENDADAVLLIDFFGYVNPENAEIACLEKQSGKIVIYDATHKLGGNPAVEAYADYSFCSYRKWFYCNFAQATKHVGSFHKMECKSNDRYLALRGNAAREKEKYFAGETVEKDKFLSLFSEAEQMLDEDYIGYMGEPVAFDLFEIALARRENAAYLISELKKIPEIQLWRDVLGDDDIPLFVPILVDSCVRPTLRRALIEESIYCPMHWPVSSLHGECNELYEMEISLICDQRYGIEDMERMVRVIQNYFKR
jgi:dTDP-4-amino-4,6-dideoxygalactose transaminase